jgi:hypothetical protein
VDAIQLQHEKAVGDEFISWLNAQRNWQFVFSERGGEAPDLIYSEGWRKLRIEVVGAYYDAAHAKLLWGNARELPNAPHSWSGCDFDEALIKDIERQIHKKCLLAYGSGCVLLVSVRPPVTVHEEVTELLDTLLMPDRVPFEGIFLAGTFPVSSRSHGGYHVWALKDIAG